MSECFFYGFIFLVLECNSHFHFMKEVFNLDIICTTVLNFTPAVFAIVTLLHCVELLWFMETKMEMTIKGLFYMKWFNWKLLFIYVCIWIGSSGSVQEPKMYFNLFLFPTSLLLNFFKLVFLFLLDSCLVFLFPISFSASFSIWKELNGLLKWSNS